MAGIPDDTETHRPPDERPTVRLPGPRRPRPRPPRRRAPVLLAALATTAWAVLVSYLPVLVAVALITLIGDGDAALGTIIRFGTAGWLLAHGVPLITSGGPVGLAPLAVSALAAWRIGRAGVHTTRAIGGRRTGTPRLAATAAGAVALVYGLFGLIASAVARGPGLDVSPVRAGLTLFAFGFLAAGVGAVRESGVLHRAADRLPLVIRDALRTGVVAALLVLGAGAAVAGTTIAAAGGDAGDMLAAYHTGFVGEAGLTLLCLAYAPNLASWAAAYLVGPGFAVGVGTTVSAGHVSLGALPAVPVLVGLPATAVSGPAALLLGVPVAAGMTAGWLLARRRIRRAADRELPAATWAELLGAAVLTGPVGGLLLGLAGWISGGPLSGGRLADTGPAGVTLALVGAGVLAFGALLGAAATNFLVGGRRR